MQDDVRASLEDLAIRWETPKGRELKAKIVADVKHNRGEGLSSILEGFLYVSEVAGGRDLRGITLEGEDLAEGIFGKCDMSWASFARSNLQRADLRSSTLKRADMTDANLSMTRFDFADCSRVDFSRSSLDGTHFKEARLTGAVFESADVSRASFESASMAKTNFKAAKLEQTNFFNADCNNANFDGNGLERVSARPAKAWGLRFDMERDEFERQVGLKAITSRTTKRFKGLDALLKLSPGAMSGEAKKAGAGEEIPVFGAPLRGTQKLKPVTEEAPMNFGAAPRAADEDASHRPTTAFREPGEPEADPSSAARRRPPPPPRPTLRRPAPMALGAPPGAATPAGASPPTGRGAGRPAGPPPGGPPTGRAPRPGAPGGPPPSGQHRPSPRPAAPPQPRLPVAPLDADAPEPLTDWAKTIGQLMQLKPTITKILVEISGEKSRVIYKAEPPR